MNRCKMHQMRHSLLFAMGVAVLCGTGGGAATGSPFTNLNFESAAIGTPVGFGLPASEALPGWAGSFSTSGSVGYDMVTLAAPAISIHDSASPILKPLRGAYSVLLQVGTNDGINPMDVYIAQIGDVPNNARSLMFSTDMTAYLSRLQVSLHGTLIPFSLCSTGDTVNPQKGPVTTYIGDVSAFAGMTDVELRFTLKCQYPLNYIDLGAVDLDAIQFSSTPAPEPSSLALLAIGLFSLVGYCWRRRQRA